VIASSAFHHFSFASPQYLLLLLLIPILLGFLVAVRRRRTRYTVAFTNLDLLAEVRPRYVPRWRRLVPLVLLVLALALAAAAVARPQLDLVRTDRGATIILLADISGSMQATDVQPARIFAAISAMHDFVDVLPKNDKVGLVTFSDAAEVKVVPTTNHTAVDNSLDVLSPEGGTALSDGVITAVKLAVATLDDQGVHHQPGTYLPAAIILESDGAQDRGSITPYAAAQFAKEAGVRVFGVALGTPGGYVTTGHGLFMQRYDVPPDPGTVALLARVTGGEAFDARTASKLDAVYRGLGSSVGRRRAPDEITPWFELAAVVLLVAAIALGRLRGAPLP
jgi:Ca-activated chloride channel homolog